VFRFLGVDLICKDQGEPAASTPSSAPTGAGPPTPPRPPHPAPRLPPPAVEKDLDLAETAMDMAIEACLPEDFLGTRIEVSQEDAAAGRDTHVDSFVEV